MSIYDLYFTAVRKFNEKNKVIKGLIYKKIRDELGFGYTSKDIVSAINLCSVSTEFTGLNFKDIRNPLSEKSDINLMPIDTFMYHNELRLIPNRPKKSFDIITGEFKTESEKFYLEMKASYTLEDLTRYIKTKSQLALTTDVIEKLHGALNYLLKRHSLDFLLFLIDTSNQVYSDSMKIQYNILSIDDNIALAKDHYNKKVSECKLLALDKVVLKER